MLKRTSQHTPPSCPNPLKATLSDLSRVFPGGTSTFSLLPHGTVLAEDGAEMGFLLQGLPLGRREVWGFVLEGFFLRSAEGEHLGGGEDAPAEEPLLDGVGVGFKEFLPFGAGEEGGD